VASGGEGKYNRALHERQQGLPALRLLRPLRFKAGRLVLEIPPAIGLVRAACGVPNTNACSSFYSSHRSAQTLAAPSTSVQAPEENISRHLSPQRRQVAQAVYFTGHGMAGNCMEERITSGLACAGEETTEVSKTRARLVKNR
jgi:hypothetical protein